MAAAITVNASENAAPAPANGSAASLTIGEQTKARGKLSTTTAAADQDTSTAQDVANADSAKVTPSTTQAGNTANPAEDASKAQADQTRSAQQPAQTANNTTATVATAGAASANSDHAAAQATPLPSASTTENVANAPVAQGPETAKTGGIDGLPNFGFPTSTATASSTAAVAAASTASTGSVPIAGLAVAIAARAQAGSNQFDISLSPPELGRIDVHLNVDGNGQATTHMTVDRPETLQLLQSQQPQLQNALEQAGLTTADNGLQFSLRDQSFTGQNNGSGAQSAPTQLVIPEPQLAPVAATQIYTRMGLGSGIDIRV